MNAIEILGLSIQFSPWDKQNKLPLYITNTFLIQKANINGILCLALTPQDEFPNISSLKKQMKKIQELENLPIFLKLDFMTDYRKTSLVQNEISFILTDKMVYLPFMYTLITNEHHFAINEKLTKFSQLIFIWILYQNDKKYYMSNAIKDLHISNMTASRGFRQLINTGLFIEYKDGRNIYLITKYEKKELIDKISPYLKSPIIYTGYIDKKDINENMIISGETALSHYSFISTPQVTTYAIEKINTKNINIYNELIDSKNQVRLEVWFYNPYIFSNDNQYVDAISLILTLIDNQDERIAYERDQLLDAILNHKEDL
ncbi:MAG: hypothetical protein LUG60_04620 [Erysipelotrichaceae bacterium]|nr:hypothetical protein [Erysipelotrichaceae bacterium]